MRRQWWSAANPRRIGVASSAQAAATANRFFVHVHIADRIGQLKSAHPI
jgi:hypothetical protein